MQWHRPTQDQVTSFFSNVGGRLKTNLKNAVKGAIKKGSVYESPSGLNYAKEMNPNIGEELQQLNKNFRKEASSVLRPYTIKAREKVLSLFSKNQNKQLPASSLQYRSLSPIQRSRNLSEYKLYNWVPHPYSPISTNEENDQENEDMLSFSKVPAKQQVILVGGKRKKLKTRKHYVPYGQRTRRRVNTRKSR